MRSPASVTGLLGALCTARLEMMVRPETALPSQRLSDPWGDDPAKEDVTMSSEAQELRCLAHRLEAILDRLEKLELEVLGFVHNQTVEAKDFVPG
ncbi:MAG TPA: hypothetical protein VN648_20115 [Candidatus Methylomirabilis sp.]|nr:hypothetical protein [Candidatus Methylomirabilis sp.]